MEVRKGYKQTEVGVIPDEWCVSQLGDVIEQGRTIRYGIVQPGKYEQNGCLMLRSQDYSKGWQGTESMHKVNSFIEAQYRNARLNKDDLIMTVVGAGIGQVVTAPYWLNGAIASRSTARIAVDKDKAEREFIKAFLISPLGKRQILDCQKEGAQPVVSCRDLSNFRIPLPSLVEQTAIATALSDTDALITSLKKLIAKKLNIKQGAMQELLKPKKGWEVKRLGDIASLKARIGWQGLTTSEYRTSGDYFLITGTEFKKGLIDWDKCFYVDEERFVQDKNIQIRQHDVLVTKDGTIGKVALIKSLPKPATLNSGVFVIRPIDESFNPEFFYYLLLSNVFLKFLGQLTAGSTINHLYQKDFVTFKFSVPKTIGEQQSIAKILLDMDEEITSLESKLEKYREIKSGMMQNLLSGKIRLV